MDIELTPKLLTGEIVQVTDLSVKLELKGKMGMVHLPNRSIITNKKPQVGDQAEIFISYIRILDKTTD